LFLGAKLFQPLPMPTGSYQQMPVGVGIPIQHTEAVFGLLHYIPKRFFRIGHCLAEKAFRICPRKERSFRSGSIQFVFSSDVC
jgi:hypothetical protein